MKITVSTESIKELNCESLILGFFSDERPPRGYCGDVDWCLNGLISELLFRGRIEGTPMEKVLFTADHRFSVSTILLLGLGKKESLEYTTLYRAGQAFLRAVQNMGCRDFAFDIPGAGRCDLDTSMMTESILRGMSNLVSGEDLLDNGVSARILGRNAFIEDISRGMENSLDMAAMAPDTFAGKERTSAQDGAA